MHLRTNALLLARQSVLKHFPEKLPNKTAAFSLESGVDSLSRRLLSRGQSILVVGSDGRGYSPIWWPESETFRLANQANLLVADNVTRTFSAAGVPERIELSRLTWGNYVADRPQFALARL